MPPLCFPLLALIAGILASPCLDNRYVWAVLPLALTIAIARPRLAVMAVFLFGSAIRAHHEVHPPYIEDDGLPARVEAVLTAPPVWRIPGYEITVRVIRVNGMPVEGKARLSYFPPDEHPELGNLFEALTLGAGDRIHTLVRLRPPGVYRNPGGFDYRSFLERRGIFWTGSIRNPRLVEVSSRGWHGLDEARRWATARVENRLSGSDTIRALALGMVLGQRRRLPASAEQQFEAAGLIHLLVVSGFNLAVVAAAALWLGRRIRFGRRQRTFALLFALGVVGLYAILVEGDTPVLRATIMAAFLIVGMLLDRGYAIGNALAAAGIVILTLNPLALLDTGFQLTFAAVLAILFLAAPLIRWWLADRNASLRHLNVPAWDSQVSVDVADWRVSKRLESELSGCPLWLLALPRRLLTLFLEAVIVTGSIQYTLLWWSIESYHRVSPVAIPLNVFGAAAAAVVTPLGLLLILLPDWAAAPIAGLMEMSLWALVQLVDWSLQLPASTFRVPSLPAGVWVAFTFLLTSGAVAIRRRSRTGLGATGVAAILLLALAVHADFGPEPPGYPTVTFVDVGQGDAVLVELPDGRRLLIDGGGAVSGAFRSFDGNGGFSVGADVLSPYLFSRGFRRLDAIALTHAHHDHMDGLFDVIENFEVGELWLGNNPMVPRYRALLEKASERAIPIRWLKTGDRAGPFRVLNPPGERRVGNTVSNDDSLVLLLETETGSILLTGDLERDLPGAPPHVTVLKVPHHGSRNARLRVSADLPVISVGANNSFGHPDPTKLPALRTDLLGAVRIVLKPEGPETSFPGLCRSASGAC